MAFRAFTWRTLADVARAVAVSKDSTWQADVDQIATWEVARRQNTAVTNSHESGTDLSMV